jgi:hypothetical protein
MISPHAASVQLARLALSGLSATERRGLLAEFAKTATASEPDRLIKRSEVARLLGRTPRTVDLWVRRGLLRRVHLPGRLRAPGFRLSDVQALIEGSAP